jgi:hypothetical protein
MIEGETLNARLRFIRRLGLTRVNTLVAYNYEEDPATEQDVLRALANSTEIKMVRLNLMRVLPTAFMDGSATLQQWNQEAPFRSASQSDLSVEMQRLDAEIEEALDLLAGDDEVGSEETIQGTNIGPDCPKWVGGSVWRRPT